MIQKYLFVARGLTLFVASRIIVVSEYDKSA